MFVWPTSTLRATPLPAGLSRSGGSRTLSTASACRSVRSDGPIDAQVQAGGSAWLDRQFLACEPAALSSGGFGREVQDRRNARIEHLIG
jgi:hypothetical protein